MWYGESTGVRRSDALHDLICSLPEINYFRVSDDKAEADVQQVLEHCNEDNQIQIKGMTVTDEFGNVAVFHISSQV